MDNELQKAVEELEAATQKIKEDAESSEGPCSACKYCINSNGFADWKNYKQWFHCENPVVAVPKFDGVTGVIKHKEVTVLRARGEYGLCGPSGRLFEPHQSNIVKTKSWLSKLFG